MHTAVDEKTAEMTARLEIPGAVLKTTQDWEGILVVPVRLPAPNPGKRPTREPRRLNPYRICPDQIKCVLEPLPEILL